jgi:outer membrane receptor protein involved in Fe transport
MKPEQSYPAPVAKRSLAAYLAAVVALSWAPVWAQQVDAAADDEEIVRLTPFEVESEKDYGYLKTNSATATRIGMEIQKIPMNVAVQSRDFLDDTNSTSLTDLFRYTASGSGDNRFAMRRPANEATPQGTFSIRGFTVNTLLRNGIFRYISYNLDNVERVEIVSGPASVFFGQGYPGGVINYITKRPSFTKIPTTFKYQIDDNSGQKFVLDHNAVLSKKAAFRIVGGWADLQGDRRFEFKDNINITPSLTLVPFDSGKLTINIEAEYLNDKFNENDYDWVYGDASGWISYVNGGGSNSVNGFAAYINTIRNSTQDYDLPAYTSIARGAFITDASGNRVQDEAFNYTSRGAYTHNIVKTVSVSAEFQPFEWLSGRYSYTKDRSDYNSLEGMTLPYGDGIHWRVHAASTAGYYRDTHNHQLDLVFEKELFGVKNKVLTGIQFNKYEQKYNSHIPGLFPFWGKVPGATNGIANPNYTQVAQNIAGSGGQVPVNQVIRDRNGNIKLVQDVFYKWDPGFEMNPSIATINSVDRVVLDQYKPKTNAWYVNYQASLLDDRLTILAGYRNEEKSEDGQFLIANYPWFIPPADAFNDTVTYPENVYSFSQNYAKTVPQTLEGDSDMVGASFALTKELSVYASHSNTFKFNSGIRGGLFPGDELLWAQEAINYRGSFTYRGVTITQPSQLTSVLQSVGAFDKIKNETGTNLEFGVKLASEDNKYVGTLSVFSATRANQRLDDGAAQSNLEEPLNYTPTDGSGYFPVGSSYDGTRLLRWRTTDLENKIEGADFDVTWTPNRNLQAKINGAWMWTAKTVYDKTRAAPGSDRYNASSAAAKVASDIYYGARLENVPEYRLNAFGKYTFTDGPVRGLTIGAGMRYSSETVVSRSVDWNPLNGGLQGGDYLVFDLTFGYPWEVAGYKITTSLGIYNVTDEVYFEGRNALSPPRNWVLTNTLSF